MYYTKRSCLVLCVAVWLVFFVGIRSWWWNLQKESRSAIFHHVVLTSASPRMAVGSKQPAGESRTNKEGSGGSGAGNLQPAVYTRRKCSIVSFARAPGPVTALAVYSNSTWFRLLLEESTGIYTSSVHYFPGERNTSSSEVAGFLSGPIRNGSVVAIETRFPYGHPEHDNMLLDKAILVVRNPRQMLATEFYRKNSRNNKTEWIQNQLDRWKNQSLSWLKFSGPLLIVQYEDMVKDLEKELDRILAFVDLSITEEKFHCVLSNFNLTQSNAANDYIQEKRTLDLINENYNYVIQQIKQWKAEKLKADLALVDLLQ